VRNEKLIAPFSPTGEHAKVKWREDKIQAVIWWKFNRLPYPFITQIETTNSTSEQVWTEEVGTELYKTGEKL
jgi:hypothetical protein